MSLHQISVCFGGSSPFMDDRRARIVHQRGVPVDSFAEIGILHIKEIVGIKSVQLPKQVRSDDQKTALPKRDLERSRIVLI